MSRTKSKLKYKSNLCLCNTCGEYLSGESAFDKHRKGEHGPDRHCVDPESIGLVIKYRGTDTFWGFDQPFTLNIP